jgi:hypothetical protein
MRREIVAARKNVVFAVALLALGIAGVALAGMTSSSSPRLGATVINVTLLEGKTSVAPTLRLSATTLTAGKVTLVVVNKGKTAHGLAIMGDGLNAKRTPTLAVGKTARLTVTLSAGMYHLWDPVKSSMTRAKFITVKAAKSGSSGGGGSVYTPPASGGGGGGGGTSTGMTMTGDDGCDHM